METKQSQIKINLSSYLKNKVKGRAGKYGLTLAGFARYLMIRDLEESDSLEPSEETLKYMRLAKSKKAKWIDIKSAESLDEYLSKL